MKEESNILFPLLLPLNFKWTKRQTVIWEDGSTSFEVAPFKVNGRESYGYRVLYSGSSEVFQYLFDRFLGCFKPTISGIELVWQSDQSQNDLISKAEKHYKRGSMFGLYEDGEVGIILMPTSEVNLQVRNQAITGRNIRKFMNRMDCVATTFRRNPVDLFSFMEGVEYV